MTHKKLVVWAGYLAAVALTQLLSISMVGADETETGSIEGRVAFLSDTASRWRLSRFYLRQKGTNSLAEAVVALRSPKLRGLKTKSEKSISVVDQRDFQFVPETTAIRAGDAVKFLNNDGPTHNVRSSHLLADFNENLPSGGEFTYTFKKATGISDPVMLGCVYHGNMRAWVFVFDQPFFTVTETPGTFRFQNVPSGEMQIDVSHPAGQMRKSQSIVVKSGETTKVELQLSLPEKSK